MDIDKEKEETMNSDLSPAMREKLSKPKKTWFFKRLGDGYVFATEEREAWDICNNRSSWKRRDFQLIGTSDGKTFHRIISESMVRARELEPQLDQKKAELQKYQTVEENLIMNEAVDMEGDTDDAENEANKKKVLRLRGIMDRIHGELDVLEEEFKSVVGDVIKTATDAEMEVAIKNQKERIANEEEIDWPRDDININTPDTNSKRRQKIVNLMNSRAN